MSPRTPASIVLGTAVTVSLFGLMQSMVQGPEAYSPPPRPPLDPFISTEAFAPTPPVTTRRVPDPPTDRRPPDGDVATGFNLESSIGPGEGPLIPRFQPDIGTRLDDPAIGEPGSRHGVAACGEAQPRLLVTPDYPRAQRVAGVEGEVEVTFTVAPDGRVIDPRVVRATPRGAFESATLRAVRQWRFEAASADCPRAAEARNETVVFRLEGVEE